MHLDHACLNVRDMDENIEWWKDHFEMKLVSRKEIPENNAEIAFVGYEGKESDAMKLELTYWGDWDDGDYEAGTQFDHVALVIDDVEAKVDELREAGVEIAKEPYSLSGSTSSKIAFVHDPMGNWIELIER